MGHSWQKKRTKIVASRMYIGLKTQKGYAGRGSTQDYAGGTYSAHHTPSLDLGRARREVEKEKRGKKMMGEGREREGRGGRKERDALVIW